MTLSTAAASVKVAGVCQPMSIQLIKPQAKAVSAPANMAMMTRFMVLNENELSMRIRINSTCQARNVSITIVSLAKPQSLLARVAVITPTTAMLNVVLVTPEIPHNTGAAGRLCLATGARLHLVKPLGFSLDDRQVRRVGLDYWPDVDLKVWENWQDFRDGIGADARMYLLTTKTDKPHWGAEFRDGDYLVFGSETKGLPESLLNENKEGCLTIPMVADSTRSLNLSTSVGIVLYEAFRQVST